METKKWWASKTIWSDVLTIILALYGAAVTIAQAHGVTLPGLENPIILAVLDFLGSMGIIGRVGANTTIVK